MTLIDQFRPPPYVDAIMKRILTQYLSSRGDSSRTPWHIGDPDRTSPTGANFYVQVPPIPVVPYVFSHMLGGQTIDPRFGNTRSVVRIDAIDYSQFRTHNLLADVLMRLQQAVALNEVTEFGCIVGMDILDAPMEIKLDGQAEDVWRQTVTIALLVTPNAD